MQLLVYVLTIMLLALHSESYAKTPDSVQATTRRGVGTLVDVGIDVHADKSMTALMVAAEEGRSDVARELLAAGADVNEKGEKGMTALHLASLAGHTDVVRILLKGGAKGNMKDNHAMTALHLASLTGHADVVEVLMGAGTEVTDDVKTFLNRGEGANVRDYSSRGMTELITASADGRIDDVRTLLKKGADVN